MSQSYNRTPSELYGFAGAVCLFFDQGIYLFGKWVEGELQEAERSASNEMFARSARARAFARCMGDDMSFSSAGFADPYADGNVTVPNRKPFETPEDRPGGEIVDEGF
jgi:hypothetical protein